MSSRVLTLLWFQLGVYARIELGDEFHLIFNLWIHVGSLSPTLSLSIGVFKWMSQETRTADFIYKGRVKTKELLSWTLVSTWETIYKASDTNWGGILVIIKNAIGEFWTADCETSKQGL